MAVRTNWTTGDIWAANDANALGTAINAAEVTANKGAANGYAGLDGNGRIPVTQLPNSVMEYQGIWNASTNTPTLADGTGNAGDVYRVTVANSARNLGSGAQDFQVGDYVIYDGGVWQKSDTTDAVATVAGRTGNVVLTSADVSGVVSLTGTETLSSKTLTNPTVTNYTESVVTVGTVTTSSTLSLTSGTVLTATLTASTACVFTMPTLGAGKSFVLILKQAATTGAGTATFTSVKWPGTTVAVTATAGALDIFSFFCDGSSWYGSAVKGYTA